MEQTSIAGASRLGPAACLRFAAGLVAAAAGRRSVANFLFGVGSTDPLTCGAVALCLGLLARLASALPARRAARIDPARTLQSG